MFRKLFCRLWYEGSQTATAEVSSTLASHAEEALVRENFRASFLWGSVSYSLPISAQRSVNYDASKNRKYKAGPIQIWDCLEIGDRVCGRRYQTA